MSSLKNQYQKEIRKDLLKELGMSNIMAVPKLVKIVVNTGLGEALTNKKIIEEVGQQLAMICGQRPTVTYAKKDISSFKLRRKDPIGLKVTLHGDRMFDFFEKLVKIVLPRLRDFRGVSRDALDGRGGFTLGLAEQIVFPEVEYGKIDKARGLEITFVTSGRNQHETMLLLTKMGVPFSKLPK